MRKWCTGTTFTLRLGLVWSWWPDDVGGRWLEDAGGWPEGGVNCGNVHAAGILEDSTQSKYIMRTIWWTRNTHYDGETLWRSTFNREKCRRQEEMYKGKKGSQYQTGLKATGEAGRTGN